MENFNGNAEVEEMPVNPIAPKPDKRKNMIIGILAILGIAGIFILLTGKGKKDKDTKRVRVIKRTKTIVKNKKGDVDEETNEETDDNETDDNGTNDGGSSDDDNDSGGSSN